MSEGFSLAPKQTVFYAMVPENLIPFAIIIATSATIIASQALITGVFTLMNEAINSGKEQEVADKLNDYEIRIVLTAHPTQFYPGSVLGIINDLAKALSDNNTAQINTYLQQLAKTPFLKRQKPTPYDEAVSLIWYLENVFYAAAGHIYASVKNSLDLNPFESKPMIRMGFWPGGDRDGNPFVTTETTLKVAAALRGSIIKCYYLS
jgi:phosphoenolpyruvate carboxylase